MKICGYCGRENEDSAIACRECGLSEFPETVADKARQMEPPAPAEAEPESLEPEVASDQEAAICPFCLYPNLPHREWCKQCGTPFNLSVMGPFESAVARGSMYRGIVRGRPKPIVLVAVWVSCLPLFLLGIFALIAGTLAGMWLAIPLGLLFAAIAGSFLFQVTRNFATIPKPKLDD